MTESRIPETIDAIVAALTSAFQSTNTPVFDGPVLSGDYMANCVYIGYDGDPSYAEELSSTTQQKWAGIGQRKRDEDNVITCAIVTLTGDAMDGWKATRDAAYSRLEVVGQTLRGDPSLGLTPPSVAEVWPREYLQEAGPGGYQARLVFSIHQTTRV